MVLHTGNVKTLNNLPYFIEKGDNTLVDEKDIIDCLCYQDGAFYMEYFVDKTYLSVSEINGRYPLLNVMIATREVFEIVADKEDKRDLEIRFEKDLWRYILMLAKIGIKKGIGDDISLEDMEDIVQGK